MSAPVDDLPSPQGSELYVPSMLPLYDVRIRSVPSQPPQRRRPVAGDPGPVLMLEVRARAQAAGGGCVVGHRLAAPVVLALVGGVRRRVPLRDPLPAGVKDKPRGLAAHHRKPALSEVEGHPLVERVVNVRRRRVARDACPSSRGPVSVPVPKKSNFSAARLLKTAIVSIRVTESNARRRAKSGDHGDNIFHHSVASLWKHDG